MDNKIKFFSSLVSPAAIKALVGKQKLNLPECDISEYPEKFHVHDEFGFSQRYINEWNRVFKTRQDISRIKIPFMYYWPYKIKFLMTYALPISGGQPEKYLSHRS